MTSFSQLRKGGRYTMLYRKRDNLYPVSVYAHPIDKDAIIVKHLDSENRGSKMALYEDQLERGVITFGRGYTTIEYPIQKPAGRSKVLCVIDCALYLLIVYPITTSLFKSFGVLSSTVHLFIVLYMMRRCVV